MTFSEAGRQTQPHQLAPSQLGRRGGGRVSMSIADRIAHFEKMSEGGSDTSSNKPDMALIGRIGSTLKANLGGGSDPLTSQARAFISHMITKAAPTAEEANYPESHNATYVANEARPTLQYRQRNVEQFGLYDVFAPSGAIGIVVDTTKDGPCVHSLKSTSPMIGLITPGDLILGVDDQDTSRMTAATLTRLMAQKSNQIERKITLQSVET